MDHLIMNTRERNYLRYLQQRVQDCEQIAERLSEKGQVYSLAQAQAFSEAATAFLYMIDERTEAENAF